MTALGTPIKGPSALGSDPRRLWHLARTMAVSDFKLRFFGSALGYLWQLVRPLLLFSVLYVVFTRVIRLGCCRTTTRATISTRTTPAFVP